MLHVSMMLWMLGHLNGRLVVHAKHQGRGDNEAELLEQLTHPDDLLASFTSSNIFSLGGGQCLDRCLDIQETAPVPILATYAPVEQPVSLQPPWFTLE